MRQSRRLNIGHKRNTIARRWRPWIGQDVAEIAEDTDSLLLFPAPADEIAVEQIQLPLSDVISPTESPNSPA